jgi:hypothetical protein
MNRPSAVLLALAPALLFGCPASTTQQCPPAASVLGQYNLMLALQHSASECRVTRLADGGATDAGLGTDIDAGRPVTLCAGPGGDGGTLLYLARIGVAGAPSTSALAPDGGFSFRSESTYGATSTACACPIDNVETFAGGLQTTSADGGFALGPDGGVPLVTSVSGSVVDHLTGTGTCSCNVPCDVRYDVSGARF